MAKSISKFIVSLKDESHFKPKFIISVVPQKEDPELFLVRLIHPNSNDPNEIKDQNSAEAKARAKDPKAKAEAFAKKIVYSQLVRAKSFSDALAEGKKMLELPEIRAIETVYEDKKHIPQPRRGKMKLKTKEEFDKEQEELLGEEVDDLDIDIETPSAIDSMPPIKHPVKLPVKNKKVTKKVELPKVELKTKKVEKVVTKKAHKKEEKGKALNKNKKAAKKVEKKKIEKKKPKKGKNNKKK